MQLCVFVDQIRGRESAAAITRESFWLCYCCVRGFYCVYPLGRASQRYFRWLLSFSRKFAFMEKHCSSPFPKHVPHQLVPWLGFYKAMVANCFLRPLDGDQPAVSPRPYTKTHPPQSKFRGPRGVHVCFTFDPLPEVIAISPDGREFAQVVVRAPDVHILVFGATDDVGEVVAEEGKRGPLCFKMTSASPAPSM